MHDQDYEIVPIDEVQPHPDNPRRGDLASLGASVEQIGFYGALVVQRSTGLILAGNHRWKYLKSAGAEEVPVLWLDCDDDRARRILVADNRVSDLGGYDTTALAVFVEELPDAFLAALQLGATTLPMPQRVEHQDGGVPAADGSGSEKSYEERLESFKQSGVRSLVLDFTVDEYREVSAVLPDLFKAHGVENTSDLFWTLVMPDVDAA